ncbi:basic proline-rich protein-like [Motacilla alba alba]|uniref:basic proline-rich protein-like n=1 Tax=Motacilla alba alba TaxID=1094192 RepID=UPI0018D53184|nr:basic proline-rich protein-like [Motacilla alba alba]
MTPSFRERLPDTAHPPVISPPAHRKHPAVTAASPPTPGPCPPLAAGPHRHGPSGTRARPDAPRGPANARARARPAGRPPARLRPQPPAHAGHLRRLPRCHPREAGPAGSPAPGPCGAWAVSARPRPSLLPRREEGGGRASRRPLARRERTRHTPCSLPPPAPQPQPRPARSAPVTLSTCVPRVPRRPAALRGPARVRAVLARAQVRAAPRWPPPAAAAARSRTRSAASSADMLEPPSPPPASPRSGELGGARLTPPAPSRRPLAAGPPRAGLTEAAVGERPRPSQPPSRRHIPSLPAARFACRPLAPSAATPAASLAPAAASPRGREPTRGCLFLIGRCSCQSSAARGAAERGPTRAPSRSARRLVAGRARGARPPPRPTGGSGEYPYVRAITSPAANQGARGRCPARGGRGLAPQAGPAAPRTAREAGAAAAAGAGRGCWLPHRRARLEVSRSSAFPSARGARVPCPGSRDRGAASPLRCPSGRLGVAPGTPPSLLTPGPPEE